MPVGVKWFYLHIKIIVSYTNERIRVGSNYYEKVKTFKYLGSLVTNQNSIQEEIKCSLNPLSGYFP